MQKVSPAGAVWFGGIGIYGYRAGAVYLWYSCSRRIGLAACFPGTVTGKQQDAQHTCQTHHHTAFVDEGFHIKLIRAGFRHNIDLMGKFYHYILEIPIQRIVPTLTFVTIFLFI